MGNKSIPQARDEILWESEQGVVPATVNYISSIYGLMTLDVSLPNDIMTGKASIKGEIVPLKEVRVLSFTETEKAEKFSRSIAKMVAEVCQQNEIPITTVQKGIIERAANYYFRQSFF